MIRLLEAARAVVASRAPFAGVATVDAAALDALAKAIEGSAEVEALRFYADPTTYAASTYVPADDVSLSRADEDGGSMARFALGVPWTSSVSIVADPGTEPTK